MRHYDLWLERYQQRSKQIIEVLERHHATISEIKERIPLNEIITPLEDYGGSMPSSMCFVDGGEGYRELLGAGLYFIRATSLLMSDNRGEDFIRDVDLGVISYDDNTKERVEFLREAMEVDVALKTIKEHHPEYVFLDGSLYVKASRKPIECAEYSAYVKKFQEFLKTSEREGIRLVGVSEDSKSRLLKQYLSVKYSVSFPDFFTDPTILDAMVSEKKYSTIKLKLKKDGTQYTGGYVKLHELANPLRVDVAGGEQNFDDAISIISMLSRGSAHYGYPLPLYLAHLDAKINAKHAEWSSNRLKHHALKENPELGAALFGRTRRDLRPGN
ncbi:MAG: DNA double-strand break repair nuclease NurA [Candidatus Altiarchaeota archaeon]